ncbi:hypothetical protein [Pseudoalteromonas sp. BMB]|uniref:hypothetical protein n=1 Tax=Pseudoalteromonas sp. BMB TaxID=1874619 RepID=UPI001112CBD2|nr:hypothetical protein [Pseudoalteromonas sp. BMB]
MNKHAQKKSSISYIQTFTISAGGDKQNNEKNAYAASRKRKEGSKKEKAQRKILIGLSIKELACFAF